MDMQTLLGEQHVTLLFWGKQIHGMQYFPFSALTLLVGRQRSVLGPILFLLYMAN